MVKHLLEWQDKNLRRSALIESILQKKEEREALEKSLFTLYITANNEQFDVEQLNRFSLKNLYYGMTGKKDELLAKEASEARAAKAEYENTKFQTEQLQRQIESEQRELDALAGCGDSYKRALQEAIASGVDRDTVTSLLKTHLQGVLEELIAAKTAVNEISEMIDDTYPVIENTRQWNSSLSGTGWAMSVPGYLNGVQAKMNMIGKQFDVLSLRLTGLPVLLITDIYHFEKNHFRELASKSGAEDRLIEAEKTLRSTQKKLFALCTSLSDQIRLAEQELSLYA